MNRLEFTFKEYKISERTKRILEKNLNDLLNLGIEGPLINIDDYSQTCEIILRKIDQNIHTFNSREKRVLSILPAYMIERSDVISLFKFDEILNIIETNTNLKRLTVNYVKTSLSYIWSKPKYSRNMLKRTLEIQANEAFPEIFKEKLLKELLHNKGIKEHFKLINKAEEFTLLNKFINLPLGWTKTEYHCIVLGDCILKSRKFETEYSKYRELIHSYTRNFQQSFIGTLYLISCMIVAGEKIDSIQTSLKRLALDHIGDPNDTSRWRQKHTYTQAQSTTINKAQQILNYWITRDFLTIFFERCLNDIRRKRFWLQYANQIQNFNIYTYTDLKRELLKDPRIRGLDSRIKVFGTGRISAIVMKTKTHDLVEFSDDGWAFRAYLKNNLNWSRVIDTRFIESAEILRSVKLPMAVRRRAGGYYDWKKAGTLHHRDATNVWESTFKVWLEKTVL